MAENNLDENNNSDTPDAGASAPGPDAAETEQKRGRGRPRKAGLSAPPADTSSPGSPGSAGTKPAGDICGPLWNTENSRPISQLPFLVAGAATGWEGWTLEDKEADALAAPLAAVLNTLVPSGGQYAAIVALASTLLVISGMKYKNYREYLESKKNAGAGQ